MKLYYFPGSCALADHIVLEWIGEPYETVKLRASDLRSSEFLALNPAGAVPLLVDGEFTLTQNVAILSHLAARHPWAQLFGNGTLRGRAEVLRWLAFLNSDVHPAFKPIFVPARFLPDKAIAGALAEHAIGNILRYFELLERQLEGRSWLADEQSVADPYLFVLLRWGVRFGIRIGEFANLEKFALRMESDPAVHSALIAEEGELIRSDYQARA
jgi:glutathione S-transferase